MAQTVINATAINSALKEMYDGQALVEESYKNNPFWALVEKAQDFFGKLYPLPISYSGAGGVSSSFASAQANIAAPNVTQFALTRVKTGYGLAQLDREAMMAASNDKGAFLKAAKFAVETTTRSVTTKMCSDIFRSGTGSLGAITSISTGLITLTVAQDIVNFDVNMVVRASSGDGSGLRTAPGYVISIDRAAGTMSVATSLGGSAATPTSWQATDFLSRDGDFNAVISGLLAWLPYTAPTSTSFFGVDRSLDTVRLGGVRYDSSTNGQSIEEALIDAVSLLNREGGDPDCIFMSCASFAALTKALGTRIIYDDVEAGEFGFRYINLATPSGALKVFQDRSCPAKTAFALTMSTWKFYSAGPAPELQTDWGASDGGYLRVGTADAGELRISGYGNLGCSAPGWNAVIKLGA